MSATRNEHLTVASVNFIGASTSAGDGGERRQALTGLLQAESPHVVLCQEMRSQVPGDLYKDLQAVARALGMTARSVICAPGAAAGEQAYTAILVSDSAGLDVAATGPDDGQPWSEALLLVPGVPRPVRFYSVHLPGNSSVHQKHHASMLASRAAGLAAGGGELAFVGGSWNCLAPADGYSQEQLAAVPPSARPAQVRALPDGTLEPVLDVHYLLHGIGLADVAAAVPPEHRNPPELTPTGPAGRTCRAYAARVLVTAVTSYRQVSNDASDDLLVMTIGPGADRASLREPRK